MGVDEGNSAGSGAFKLSNSPLPLKKKYILHWIPEAAHMLCVCEWKVLHMNAHCVMHSDIFYFFFQA